MSESSIAVVGAGMIGRSWAIGFARAGYRVRIHDPVAGLADEALRTIAQMADRLASRGLLLGQTTGAVMERINACESLAAALEGAVHIQENAPENLDVKRALFRRLDAIAAPEAVIASSTSALLPSQFSSDLAGAARCLVAHPLNPPHLIPVVEIVPSPATSAEAIEATCRLMAAAGQKPIVARREIAGFIMNRLQGALLDEAFALLAEGYASMEDIDTAVRDGLARRWSFMGPFETIDLNAPDGIAGFIERYGPAYSEIGRQRPNRYAWIGELVKSAVDERRRALPADALQMRQAWRDERLAALAAFLIGSEGS